VRDWVPMLFSFAARTWPILVIYLWPVAVVRVLRRRLTGREATGWRRLDRCEGQTQGVLRVR
jgi:hypothetical protein